jgi:hypothetical protein
MCESIASPLANLLTRDSLLRRSRCPIKYVGHHTSLLFVCQRLDQAPELHPYPSTQGIVSSSTYTLPSHCLNRCTISARHTRPSDLDLLICIHRRRYPRGLLHCKYIRSNEMPPVETHWKWRPGFLLKLSTLEAFFSSGTFPSIVKVKRGPGRRESL